MTLHPTEGINDRKEKQRHRLINECKRAYKSVNNGINEQPMERRSEGTDKEETTTTTKTNEYKLTDKQTNTVQRTENE